VSAVVTGLEALVLRSVHAGCALTLAFLAAPWRKRAATER
jgi:hypothetical protein